MKLKGQSAVEFLMYSVLFLSLLLVAVAVLSIVQRDEVNRLKFSAALNRFDLVVGEMKKGFFAPANTTYCLHLPASFRAQSYNLTLKREVNADLGSTRYVVYAFLSLIDESGQNVSLVRTVYFGPRLVIFGNGQNIMQLKGSVQIVVDEQGNRIEVKNGGC